MSNALSLRRVPLLTIRAHPVRSLIIAVLALAQAACVFGGLILVGAMRAELSLAERRLGADLTSALVPTASVPSRSSPHRMERSTEAWSTRSSLPISRRLSHSP